MNVLVFGANGFLGKALQKSIEKEGHAFFGASRNIETGYKIDISKYEDFLCLPQNYFDVVINCATILPGGNFLDSNYLNEIYETNILGTQNICKWISNQKQIKKIINCSTLVVVNKPWAHKLTEETPTYPVGSHVLYCSSKLMQELIVETTANQFEIDFVNIRFSAIYGNNMPKKGIIWNLYNQAKNQKEINIVNGNKVSFDFINVIDAANIITALLKNNSKGILNVASGVETSLYQLATIIKNNVDKSITIINKEEELSVPNRAVISIEKLNSIIETKKFIDLDNGINQLVMIW